MTSGRDARRVLPVAVGHKLIAGMNGAHLSPNGASSHSPGQAAAPPWVFVEKGICPVGAASQNRLKLAPFIAGIAAALLVGTAPASAVPAVSLDGRGVTLNVRKLAWQGTDSKVTKANEKTPDGEETLAFQLPASEKGLRINSVAPEDFGRSLAGVDAGWKTLSFWIKPEDSGQKITLIFAAKDESSGAVSYHSAVVPLTGRDWKKITVESLYNKDTARLPLKSLQNISLTTAPGQESSFLLGPLTFSLTGNVRTDPVKTVIANKAEQPPVLDGTLDEACWKDAASLDGFGKEEAAPFLVKLCFDEENLYVGFSQTIDTSTLKRGQTSPDGDVWADDSLQVLISPGDDNRTFHQFSVNSLNTAQTHHNSFDQVADTFVQAKNLFAGKWQSAVSVKPDQWSAEMIIPRALRPELLSDDVHGLQVLVANPSKNRNLFWSPTGQSTHVSDFGIMAFSPATSSPSDREDTPTAALLMNQKIPSAVVFTGAGLARPVTVRLCDPNGRIAKSEAKVFGAKTFGFGDARPASGVQRLSVLTRARDTGAISGLLACKTEEIRLVNPFPYGTDILIPQPKKNSEGEGHFAFTGGERIHHGPGAETLATADKVRADLSGFLQRPLELAETGDLPPNCLVIGKIPLPAAGKDKFPNEGGYTLEVSPGGIAIRGDSPRGLFHGAVTLSQLARYAFLRNEHELKSRKIEDWPDLPFRVWTSWFDVLYSQYGPSTKGVDAPEEVLGVLYDYLDRLAIGSKMSLFALQNPTSIRYESEAANAFSHPCAFMSISQLGELAEHSRSHYVEFVPALHGPSHMNWLTSKHPEIILPGYNEYDADPTHEKFYGHLFGMYEELIKATNPRFFQIWSDEWWHIPTGPVSTTHKGRERRDIYLETILKIHGFFRERDIDIVMFTDMLLRDHNGGKPFDNHLNADKLPKDIVMSTWTSSEAAVKHFAELGHRSWFIDNLCPQIAADKLRGVENFNGLGVINYDSITPDFGYGAAGMIRSADLGWNFWTDPGDSLGDWLHQNGPNVMALYSVRPNPHATTEFVPVDLAPLCNASYADPQAGWQIAGLPQGKSDFGFIPTLINPEKSDANVIRGEAKPVVIPVQARASSLIFLHTQYCPPTKQAELISMSSPRLSGAYHGLKTGVYVVNYADGAKIPVHVRNVINCGNWLPFKGRTTSLLNSTYLLDTRYVWTNARADGTQTCLYQYEWVNPRPEVPIETIEFTSMGTPAVPYLFALTLRKTGMQNKNPQTSQSATQEQGE